MQQQPKHITKNFKYRNIPIGNDRRVMAARAVQDNQPHFPKAVGYADVDQAVFDWVDKTLEINYLGKRLPTYKLFSNQRAAEYVQNWQNVDEKGNLNLNFKTLTRETNPQKGELTGNNYNIPADLDIPLFKTYYKEEKGDEIVQIYSMKQPFVVNLIYTVTIVTNTLQLLNEMNLKVHKEFKALERYIYPNNHPMPMELNSVSDESDYTIDDRKYYAQNYQIKVMAYIIDEEDFKVTKVRSRLRNQFVVGENSGNKKKKEKYDIGILTDNENKLVVEKVNPNDCENDDVIVKIEHNDNIEEQIYTEATVEIEDIEGCQTCWEGTIDEIVVHRKIIYTATLNVVHKTGEFIIEDNVDLETIQLENIKSYSIEINGIEVNPEEDDIIIKKGDKLKLTGNKAVNPLKNMIIKLICYDIDTVERENKVVELN